jgi:nitrogen fixation NifU-like protein
VLTGERPPEAVELGKLACLAGVRRYPSRIKCALLGWHALAHALQDAVDDPSPALPQPEAAEAP